MTNGSSHLSTWVTSETKQRFAALAREFGLSESALLKRSINLILQSTSMPESAPEAEPKIPKSLRVYVRLSPDDHRLLFERAAARGMPAATYASFLLRSHLRSLTPLPDQDLAALTAAVSRLGEMGRALHHIAEVATRNGSVEGFRPEVHTAILRALEALRDHVKNLVRSNIESWETGHAPRD